MIVLQYFRDGVAKRVVGTLKQNHSEQKRQNNAAHVLCLVLFLFRFVSFRYMRFL